MNFLNVAIPIYSETVTISLNWIGKLILGLVTAVGSVGIGIILFSLILKTITLPFDVYQRISMRKQNIKMKENQARMEKLQKQYANDKDMYNQKVMEMYKENGISTFSSCLPMILTMVIFFVAINAFNTFASYSNVNNYNALVSEYNKTLLVHAPELTEENVTYVQNGKTVTFRVEDKNDADKLFYYTVLKELDIEPKKDDDGKLLEDENGKLVYDAYVFNFTEEKEYIENNLHKEYYLNAEKYLGDDLTDFENTDNLTVGDIVYIRENAEDATSTILAAQVTVTVKDSAKLYYYEATFSIEPLKNKNAETGEDEIVWPTELKESQKAKFIEETRNYILIDTEKGMEKEQDTWQYQVSAKLTENAALSNSDEVAKSLRNIFVAPAQIAVKEIYNTEVKGDIDFLWIKNIWETDATFKNPVLKYKDFSTAIVQRSSCSCSCKADNSIKSIPAYTESGYNNVTAQLSGAKSSPNGYFILIALSIGTILLQQFVSQRASKEQQKYSSVDGQQGSQQKMMMFMMTGMFAIFAFMYSSAFSIYMIISNVYSLVSTLVINKVVDVITAKKEAKAEQEKYQKRFAGRNSSANKNGKIKEAKIVKQKPEKSVKTDKSNKKK